MKSNITTAALFWANVFGRSEAMPPPGPPGSPGPPGPPPPHGPRTQDCLCLPSDSCWPSPDTWSSLNSTVNGKLVATVPIGSPCHDPTYDADACDQLQQQWLNPLTQLVPCRSFVSGSLLTAVTAYRPRTP
jgi:hypothetical protein